MNGADVLISTLTLNGVSACFANPGTSEMQFVAALDRHTAMRSLLCLFEGVATGAADGYGRMADTPACTLLHLGPGYGNGLANLHNARRAYTPIVNIIGDHATFHRQYDAPLHSDIPAIVAPNSTWVGSADSPEAVGNMTAQAISASYGPPAGPVSLILPADSAWLQSNSVPVIAKRRVRAVPEHSRVHAAAREIRAAKNPVVLLGSHACRDEGLRAAGRLQAAGVRVMADTFIARLRRGAGIFSPQRIQYHGELAMRDLDGVDLVILAGTTTPVAFFAYPDRPSVLLPADADVMSLADRSEDAVSALEILAEAVSAPTEGARQPYDVARSSPSGALSAQLAGISIARHLPESAIVCDDSVTSRVGIAGPAVTCAPHEVLALTGGAIGAGLPMAIGAAVAASERKVVSLNGDGAAMYTVQALWTIARENLDIITVIFANNRYQILNTEMARTAAGNIGPQAARLLDLGNPEIEWTGLARSLGVEAVRCDTAEAFDDAFGMAMRRRGPLLIQAVL